MKSIIIADSTPLFVEGLLHLFEGQPELKVRNVHFSFESLLKELIGQPADLLLFDTELEPSSKTRQSSIWKRFNDQKTILFHSAPSPGVIKKYFNDGVKGYLLKCIRPEEVIQAVRTVLDGQVFIQESVRKSLLEHSLGLSRCDPRHVRLTPRELQVVELICNEYSTQEIADKLFISFNTVESHRKNVILKLGVRNSAGLVREVMRRQLFISSGLG